MKVLILGGSGLVGSRFLQLASDYEMVAPPHTELDLLDFKRLEDFVLQSDCETVLNFAAFTNVDEAEKEKDDENGLAYKLNVLVPEILARNCLDAGKHLIHISSDYIFDGNKQTPYKEEDTPTPVNWYGTTKMLGDDKVISISPGFLIARPEMPYSSFFEKKLDIARTFVKLLKEGKQINAVNDQKITPTYVDTLVYGLLKLIEVKASGIYNLASTDYTTPYDFAVLIAGKFTLDKSLIKAVKFSEYNPTRPAKRPQNSYLNTSKFELEFGKDILMTNEKSIEAFKSGTELK